jgi:hypothetical protein
VQAGGKGSTGRRGALGQLGQPISRAALRRSSPDPYRDEGRPDRRACTDPPRGGLIDLEEFVHDHRPHGGMTGDATEPVWNGYMLTVACACGVTFKRWVTRGEDDADLLDSRRRTEPPT